MSLRQIWNEGTETLGCWLSIPSHVSAEIAAGYGYGFVCIDLQHGAIDYQTATSMLQAVELGGGLPIVRAPWNDPSSIGKLLDAGAHGIIAPMVNTADEARSLVDSCRYAPAGKRSWGPTLTKLRHPDARVWADQNITVIPMIETTQALENLDEIVSVDGVDAVYVGPADLSLTLGLEPGNHDGVAEFDDALSRIVDACQRHGKVAGIHASAALAQRRREQGFQMMTVSGDVRSLNWGLQHDLAEARGTDAQRSDAVY